jgi:hypothetical protein
LPKDKQQVAVRRRGTPPPGLAGSGTVRDLPDTSNIGHNATLLSGVRIVDAGDVDVRLDAAVTRERTTSHAPLHHRPRSPSGLHRRRLLRQLSTVSGIREVRSAHGGLAGRSSGLSRLIDGYGVHQQQSFQPHPSGLRGPAPSETTTIGMFTATQ